MPRNSPEEFKEKPKIMVSISKIKYMDGDVLFVKVGDKKHEPTQEMIDNIHNLLRKEIKIGCIVFPYWLEFKLISEYPHYMFKLKD